MIVTIFVTITITITIIAINNLNFCVLQKAVVEQSSHVQQSGVTFRSPLVISSSSSSGGRVIGRSAVSRTERGGGSNKRARASAQNVTRRRACDGQRGAR